MSVQRYNLEKCIGCQTCMEVCPMDVFRFNAEMGKSVIAYPDNCQTCAQCMLFCPGHSLAISGEAYGYPLTSIRAASVLPMNRRLLAPEQPRAAS